MHRVDVLAARARQAFLEYTPFSPPRPDRAGRIYRRIPYGPLLDVFVLDMRTYRGPNNVPQNDPAGTAILGDEQLGWLLTGLSASSAKWKVIASDMPIGLLVPDGPGTEAVAQGAPGAPLGREVEIRWLLSALRAQQVRNVVWLTADVHYTAAHEYHPARAADFTDFDPFWEFVSGPLNAGTYGPNTLDPTFGPEVKFVMAPPPGQENLPPSKGMQFFGHVHIDGASGELTVELRDSSSAVLWSTHLPA